MIFKILINRNWFETWDTSFRNCQRGGGHGALVSIVKSHAGMGFIVIGLTDPVKGQYTFASKDMLHQVSALELLAMEAV